MTSLAARTRSASVPGAARTRNAAWTSAATLAIWGSSLAIAVLWVAGSGVQSLLGGGAEALDSLGRLTGLVSANLLLYQVLLMARVPLFERGFGRDAITRMHRLVGFWSFALLVAHIILLAVGYAIQAGIDPLSQLWSFVWDYPGMLLATAGTGLLVMVVITSIRRARRRLRYESWHLLHLYGYLGVGLAIPHMLWTGADFVGNPLSTAYWWTLWAVTAGAVVVWRVALPLWRTKRGGITVRSVSPDGARGVVVRMRGRGVHRLRARAGQFFVWRFLDGPGWSRGHPFSLAAAPVGDELVISAKVVGDGTRRLTTLAPGTRVVIEGPYGRFTGDVRKGRRLLMIGAGAGVAPLVALLESEPYASGEATLVTRDHDPLERMRSAEIVRLATGRGVQHFALDGARGIGASSWLPATYAGWAGGDLLRRIAPQLEQYDVFVCGPVTWMTAVCRDLRTAGVAGDRIHTEAFSV